MGETRKVEKPFPEKRRGKSRKKEGGRWKPQKKRRGKSRKKEGGNLRKKEGGKIEKSTQNGLRKSGQNIGNPYQIEDNKTQGGGAKRRPLGAAPKAPPCCLPFGKDFLCFWCISGALLDPDGPRPPMEITAPVEITTPHLYSGFYNMAGHGQPITPPLGEVGSPPG